MAVEVLSSSAIIYCMGVTGVAVNGYWLSNWSFMYAISPSLSCRRGSQDISATVKREKTQSCVFSTPPLKSLLLQKWGTFGVRPTTVLCLHFCPLLTICDENLPPPPSSVFFSVPLALLSVLSPPRRLEAPTGPPEATVESAYALLGLAGGLPS